MKNRDRSKDMGTSFGAGMESSDRDHNGAPQMSSVMGQMETATHARPYAVGTGTGNSDGTGTGALTGSTIEDCDGAVLGKNTGALSWLAYHPASLVHTSRQGTSPPPSTWLASHAGSTGLALRRITLNLGVAWVLHQNGWVQNFENYLKKNQA